MINFATADREKIIEDVKLTVKKRCLEGFHCSEASFRALIEVLQLDVSDDLIRSVCGFRGGGGGYRDRCGIIEVGSIIISLLYGRDYPNQDKWPYSYLIRILHDRFKKEFGSIYCRDILFPLKEKRKENPCLPTYEKGCEIILNLLFESDTLLTEISQQDRII